MNEHDLAFIKEQDIDLYNEIVRNDELIDEAWMQLWTEGIPSDAEEKGTK